MLALQQFMRAWGEAVEEAEAVSHRFSRNLKRHTSTKMLITNS